MDYSLIVFAMLYLPGLSNGQPVWTNQDTLYHQIFFESMEACDKYKDRRADDIADYLLDELNDYWSNALKEHLRPGDIRLVWDAECFDETE